ncbi:MAG: HNH endonuclease [Chloroflexi bacterium]|nr:HNH endonuclease [Chloroflexota bacterium]
MAQRISERELILPALYCIDEAGGRLSTSELIACLVQLLKPAGEDALLLEHRSDTKFTQKVRNLNSHKTLQTLGLATKGDKDEDWDITANGQAYLREYGYLLTSVISQGFDYANTVDVIATAPEPDTPLQRPFVLLSDESNPEYIIEGSQKVVKLKIYERSRRLRELAIEYYTHEGRIRCDVCGFDFEAVYGEHGAGFIEIHHTKPIFSYEDEDIEQAIHQAILNVVPLCSNCHRMIHHKRDTMLTIAELKTVLRRLSE